MSRSDLFRAESISAFASAVREELAASVVRARRARDDLTRQVRLPRPSSTFNARLSYGRHRGPARRDSRRAAVVIVVYPNQSSGRLCLTLTRRPMALSHHGGQVCLPGGRIESGETPIIAALREYQEELGVPADVVDVVGCLVPIYVFASDNLVETLIVTANTPSESWRPDPVEVDEVIEMPLEGLLSLYGGLSAGGTATTGGAGDEVREASRSLVCEIRARKKDRIGKRATSGEVFQYEFGYRAIEFVDCEGRRRELWGATAMLLDEFAQVIGRAMVGRP